MRKFKKEETKMVERMLWFSVGYVFAKITNRTECGKKIKNILIKCKDTVKEEFKRNGVEKTA